MTEQFKNYVIMLDTGEAEDWEQTPIGIFKNFQQAEEFCYKNNKAIEVLKETFLSINCDASDISFLTDVISTMIFRVHEVKVGLIEK